MFPWAQPPPLPPAQLSKQQDWWRQHRIVIGEGQEGVPSGSHNYGRMLASSTWCLVLPGERRCQAGWLAG